MLTLYKILIIATALGTGIILKNYYPNYRDDNPIEELVEEVIESQTGVSIDITPLSPEKNESTK
ncbi:MAG: hypothetical protein ACO3UU_11625 [Minisyncoccia bacterium]